LFDAATHPSSQKALRRRNSIVFHLFIHAQEPTRTALPLQYKLALNWLCFFMARRADYYHNILLIKSLHRFARFKIGFVF
jgi:hypothetical protein